VYLLAVISTVLLWTLVTNSLTYILSSKAKTGIRTAVLDTLVQTV